jgi:hypothetical protein
MNTERKPAEGIAAQNTESQGAKRNRRVLRASDAFRNRAEASERRWLAALRVRD